MIHTYWTTEYISINIDSGYCGFVLCCHYSLKELILSFKPKVCVGDINNVNMIFLRETTMSYMPEPPPLDYSD